MVEFFVRHGDHLVDTTVVTDPVFLTEPEVRSDDFFRQPTDPGAWLYACDDGEEIIGRPPDAVPNYLFGAQPFAKEYSKKYKIPMLSGIAGAASIYPEFAAKLQAATDAEAIALLRPAAWSLPGKSRGGSGTARWRDSRTAGFRQSRMCWSAMAGTLSWRPATRSVCRRHWVRQAFGQGD